MSTTRTARTPGIIGAVGGTAIVVLAALQLADRLSDTADVLSVVGFVCLAAVPLALLRLGATPTRVGRFGLILWFIGLLAIPLGGVAEAFYPIGGFGQLVGGLIAGSSIARAGALDGWVRWAPLAWAVTYAAMMPFGFTDSAGFAVVFAVFGLVAAATSLGVARAATPEPELGRVAAPAR